MSKADKIKARAPRGFADRGPPSLRRPSGCWRRSARPMSSTASRASRRSFVEYTDALGKFLPDQDRPNEGVFSFQDDDEQWLSLRYDLTAPLARYVAENFDALPKPYRSYRGGWVFRNEKPGPGRFRQFMQFDADTVGAASVAADAEICMMAADTLDNLGIWRGHYVIKINNRKVLDGVLEAIGLAGEDNAGAAPGGSARHRQARSARAGGRRAAPRPGSQGRERRLHQGRRARAGRHRARAGLHGCAGRKPAPTTIENLRQVVSGSARGAEGVGEFAEIAALVEASGYGDRVVIDPVRRARPRILHRPRLRGRADLPGRRTRTDARCASARSAAAGAMTDSSAASGRAGSGDRVLHRRLAPVLGAADGEEPDRVGRHATGPGRGAGDGQGSDRVATSAWSRPCARPASAPSSISARPA